MRISSWSSDVCSSDLNRIRAEGAVSQTRQALGTVVARVREKLDCALDDVLEAAEIGEGQELPPREEVEAKLARLVRERDNMGAVNLRAEVEARELDEQIVGMQSARSDLVNAIARLRQGIASLNREGRERLLAAFEAVNTHFQELFRSEEHTSELQSLMRISYAVFCLKKKK